MESTRKLIHVPVLVLGGYVVFVVHPITEIFHIMHSERVVRFTTEGGGVIEQAEGNKSIINK